MTASIGEDAVFPFCRHPHLLIAFVTFRGTCEPLEGLESTAVDLNVYQALTAGQGLYRDAEIAIERY